MFIALCGHRPQSRTEGDWLVKTGDSHWKKWRNQSLKGGKDRPEAWEMDHRAWGHGLVCMGGETAGSEGSKPGEMNWDEKGRRERTVYRVS